MIMTKISAAAVGTFLVMALAVPTAWADDISITEGARMKERQGEYLTRQERDALRRHGGNDDYGYGPGGYYDYGYYGGPTVGVYIGPPRSYGWYGY